MIIVALIILKPNKEEDSVAAGSQMETEKPAARQMPRPTIQIACTPLLHQHGH